MPHRSGQSEECLSALLKTTHCICHLSLPAPIAANTSVPSFLT